MNPSVPAALSPRSRNPDAPSTPESADSVPAAVSTGSPPGSPRAQSERARRAAELPERPRSPVTASPEIAAHAPAPAQDNTRLPGMMLGLQLDSIALMAHAADAGFMMQGVIVVDVAVAPVSADLLQSPDSSSPYRRTHLRGPTARRLIFGDDTFTQAGPDTPAPATRPSNASIEALSSQLEAWVAAGAPGDERAHRRAALETIELAHAFSFTTLDLGMGGLTCLPDCLGLLTSVRHLELDDNLLTELPEVLPPNLQRICAANNRLTHFPPNLPASITHADFSGNFIRSIPDTLHEGLVGLYLSSNGLQSLPAALPASLRHARFNLNPIDEIPDWVYRMHPDTSLQFSPDSLSTRSIDAAYVNAALSVGDLGHGPQLVLSDFNPVFGNDESAPPLEQVFPARPAPIWHWELNEQDELVLSAPGETSTNWRSRLGDEPNDHRAQFIHLIDQLQHTAEFAHPDLHRPFCTRVATLLRRLETDAPGRALCFAIAAEWSGTCEDGVALAFDNMEMALYCAEVERGNLSSTELAKLGGQMMRYEALERFTLALPGADNMDLTEAALLLRTALIDDLDLPTHCQTMTYAAFAVRSCMIDQETVDAARAYVESETGGEALIDYLAHWQPWITRLKLDHPERAAEAAQSSQALKRALTQQMEHLDDNKEEMGSGDYDRAVKALAVRYNAIEDFNPETRRELTIKSIETIVLGLQSLPTTAGPPAPG